MATVQDVIAKLEEIIAKYPYGAPTLPWGLIRDDLIHASEQLKQIAGYVQFIEQQVTGEPDPDATEESLKTLGDFVEDVQRWDPVTGRQKRRK